jgi:hypothetical protein
MFEEVPPVPRGLAGLRFRRVALGPFAIGVGLALVAIGGSVAVAATVFTAASMGSPHPGNNDLPAHPQPIAVPASTASSASSSSAASSTGARSVSAPAPTVASPPDGPVSLTAGGPSWTAPVRIVPAGTPVPSAGSYSPGPAPTSSGPAGNALVYITGYDRGDRQLVFQYATRVPGGGGSDLYQVSSPAHYHAGLATSLSIISGGTLCPPAGSSCSVAELIAAAPGGFFAAAALDPAAEFESIIEVDNATNQAVPAPSPSRDDLTPTASASPSG